MNQQSSTDSISSSGGTSADAVSRRAYELWENEGRPEGSDLRHWLQAEQELSANRSNKNGASTRNSDSNGARAAASDSRPLQGTRAASAANRDQKRGSATPFASDRNVGTGSNSNSSGQSAAKRKPASAPAL